MTPYDLGETIRKLRKEQKLSQSDVAKHAGISRPTLSKIERGILANVSIRALFLVLDAIGYEVEIVPKAVYGVPVLD